MDLRPDTITMTGKTGASTIPSGPKTITAIDRPLRLLGEQLAGWVRCTVDGQAGALRLLRGARVAGGHGSRRSCVLLQQSPHSFAVAGMPGSRE